jgi:glycosyltransferase involved in cell wall biosynthesis
MKSILMITHWYPFNYGDSSFIKNEIPYIAKKFDKVYVLCLNKSQKDILNIPENVSTYFLNDTNKILKRIFFLISAFFSPFLYQEISYLFKTKKLSIRTIVQLLLFVSNVYYFKYNIEIILANDRQISLIYTFWNSSETAASLLLKKKFGIKCASRIHRYDLYENIKEINYQPYKSYIDKNIDKIFFISKHGYDYYLNRFSSGNMKKYELSYLGIENNYQVAVKQMKEEYMNIISCAYIVPVKRIYLIIDAISKISEIKIRWTHIGDGPDKEIIIALAKTRLEDKRNIVYDFKGFMPNDKIMEYYNNNFFDCFISVSESEGLPVSMMEAISFGIPIIATNVGGVCEIVTEKTGVLLNPNCSVFEIKEAILQYYNLSDDLKLEMRNNARLFWESNFNSVNNYTNFSNEMERLVN